MQHTTCACAHALSAFAAAAGGTAACATRCPGDAASVCGSADAGLYSARGTAVANTTCSSEPVPVALAQPAAFPLAPATAAQTSLVFQTAPYRSTELRSCVPTTVAYVVAYRVGGQPFTRARNASLAVSHADGAYVATDPGVTLTLDASSPESPAYALTVTWYNSCL